MSTLNVAINVNQPGPAYIEQLQQFPSASGGPNKWKTIARYELRPGDDRVQFHPTFVISANRRIRIRAEAQVLINVPAGTGQTNGTATLYDRNMVQSNAAPYQINNVTPANRGGPATLTVGAAATNIVVNPWQYLEVTGTGAP